VRLGSHLARLGASVAALYGAQLPGSATELIEATARNSDGISRLRIDAVPGAAGALDITVRVAVLGAPTATCVRVWTLPGGLGSHKWSDRRLIEAIEARSPGEIPLLVDADGYVLETSRASVFALGRDGTLRTPPDDGRILPGIARARLIAQAGRLGVKVIAAPLLVEDLICGRGVVLTSALRHVPVLALNGRALEADPELTALVDSALQTTATPRA
jgi:para-aminobenzoate synthetase/4-amino-4-deoxychorismate lyase